MKQVYSALIDGTLKRSWAKGETEIIRGRFERDMTDPAAPMNATQGAQSAPLSATADNPADSADIHAEKILILGFVS
ncbi:MAG: hypothetical protein AAF525_14170 [Pseudomonadota bacterium]